MDSESQRSASELSNFITTLVGKTLELVNKKINLQLNFIEKSGSDVIKKSVTNLISLHGSYNLMIAKSHIIWAQRKIIKAKNKETDADYEKLNKALIDFWNSAESTKEPLQYFSKIFDPAANNKSDKISSISDILKEIEKFNNQFKTKYLKTIKAKEIKIGSSEVYISGLLIEDLINKHKAQLSQIDNKDSSSFEYFDEYVDCVDCSGDFVKHIIKLSNIKNNYKEELERMKDITRQLNEYIVGHSEKYSQSNPEPCDDILSCIGQIKKIDYEFILQQIKDQIKHCDIRDPKLLEEEFNKVESYNKPPKRTDTINKILKIYDSLSPPMLPEIDIPKFTSDKIKQLTEIIKFEEENKKAFSDLEISFDKEASKISELVELIEYFIKPNQTETCVVHSANYAKYIITADFIPRIAEKYSLDLSMPKSQHKLEYDSGYSSDELSKLAKSII